MPASLLDGAESTEWFNVIIQEDPIVVEGVSLGHSAPRLYNARVIPRDSEGRTRIRIDTTYTDTISLRLTTSLFFNQPVPGFARLPVSLSLALNLLQATIIIIPPIPDDPEPMLTLQLQPDVELSLKTSSLLGSRAKLENVSKVHELIEARIKRALVERGTWRIHLPMKHQ
ncbi:ERMES complex subunit mmm1 [Serendipita sp. 399]|nr:ERMES complex subunit mmm1 [Serendipita sp. 399]